MAWCGDAKVSEVGEPIKIWDSNLKNLDTKPVFQPPRGEAIVWPSRRLFGQQLCEGLFSFFQWRGQRPRLALDYFGAHSSLALTARKRIIVYSHIEDLQSKLKEALLRTLYRYLSLKGVVIIFVPLSAWWRF